MLRTAVYDCMMRWFGDVMLSIYICMQAFLHKSIAFNKWVRLPSLSLLMTMHNYLQMQTKEIPGNQIVVRDDCLWSSRYFSEFYDNHHSNLMDSGLKRAVSKTLALASGVIDPPT